MQNQELSSAANNDLLTGETLSVSNAGASVKTFSVKAEFIDAAGSAELTPVSATDNLVVSSAAARAGDVVLANVMPQAEYMYGCTPTALAMLFGYYDLYGSDDLSYANLIEGDVAVNSRGSDGNIYNMNEFDSVLGRFIASPDYVKRFFGTVNSRGETVKETTPEEELPYTFVNGGSSTGVSEVNVSLWDCLSDYIGTSQYWRGNDNYSTTYYTSNDPNAPLTLARLLVEPGTEEITSGSTTRTVDWRFTSLLYGINLYVESRGYTLDENLTGNYRVDTNGGNFTFEDYMAEIDAGHPVLLSITGHSMVGYGYNASTRQIIFDDTYFSGQTMTWGGTYYYADEYRELLAVTIIHLEGGASTYPVEYSIGSELTEAISTDKNTQIIADGGITCGGPFALQLTEEDHAVYMTGGSIVDKTTGAGAAILFGTGVDAASTLGSNYLGTLIFNGSESSLDCSVVAGGSGVNAAVVAARILNVSMKGSAAGSSGIAISLTARDGAVSNYSAFQADESLSLKGDFSGEIDVEVGYSADFAGTGTRTGYAFRAGSGGVDIDDTFAGTVTVSVGTGSALTDVAGAYGVRAGTGFTAAGQLNGDWTVGAAGGAANAFGISAASITIAKMGASMSVTGSGANGSGAYGLFAAKDIVITAFSGKLVADAAASDGIDSAYGVFSAGTLSGSFAGTVIANGAEDAGAFYGAGVTAITVTGNVFAGYYADVSALEGLLDDSFINRRELAVAATGSAVTAGGAGSSITISGDASVFGGINLTGDKSSLTLSGDASVYGRISSVYALNFTISLAGTSFNHTFLTTDSTANFSDTITVDVSSAAVGTYQLINSADLTVDSITLSGGFDKKALAAGNSFQADDRIYFLSRNDDTLRLTIAKTPGSEPDPDEGPLTVPAQPTASVENGVAVFDWKAAVGIGEAIGYRLRVDDTYYFTPETSYTLALAEGAHSIAVQVLDSDGAWGGWTTARSLVVGDTEAPVLTGLPYATINGAAVKVEWGAGRDNSFVEGYILRIDDTEYTVRGTSCTLNSVAGTHTFAVRAFDAAGNFSNWSETQAFEIADQTAPEFTSGPRIFVRDGQITINWAATDDVGVTGYTVELGGAVVQEGMQTSYSFAAAEGKYTFRVQAADAFGHQTWTVPETFTYDDDMAGRDVAELLPGRIGADNPEAVFAPMDFAAGKYLLQGAFGTLNAKIFVIDANGKKVAALTVKNGLVSGKDLLLDGEYSIVVQSADKGKTSGDFTLSTIADLYDRGNNADDNYRTLTPAYQVEVGDSACALTSNEWVGYGDAVDYRAVQFEYAGKYTFSFSATDAAKLTIWTVNANGTLKALKTVSVKAGQAKTISGLVLDPRLYYISVESTNAKQGGSADYCVTLTGNSAFYTNRNNADDNPSALGAEYRVTLDGAASLRAIGNDWVGYGDAVDYRAVTVETEGDYRFVLSGATDKVKLTLFTVDANGRRKTVKSIALNSGTGFFDVRGLDSEKNYLIAVESPVAKKGGGSDYALDILCTRVEEDLAGWRSSAVSLDRYEQPSLAGYSSDSAVAASAAPESNTTDEKKRSLALLA